MKPFISKLLRSIFGWVYVILILFAFLLAIYFFIFTLFHLSKLLVHLATNNQLLANYLSSIIILFVLYIISSEKTNTILNKYANRLEGYKEKFFSKEVKGVSFILKSILILPKRTIIFILYFFILIYNQLYTLVPGFGIFHIITSEFQAFLKTNEYAIILLIALDRISNNFNKEKPQSKENLISLLSRFIK